MSEATKTDSANTSSVQSTPTPPNSGQSTRSRRSLRKCATPIKSADKVEKGERVPIPQFSLSDTSSTNNTVTPDSANISKPPKQQKPVPATPSATPIRRQVSVTPRKKGRKGRKRIPFALVEASKGNRCPTPNCKGLGHATGLYAMHYTVSGCPIAARNKAAAQKAKEGSPSSSKASRPPSFPKKKKRKRGKAGRKKRQGFGKMVGSNKRDSDTTADDAGDTTSSSDFSDSDGGNGARVKEEGTGEGLARGLRSAGTSSGQVGEDATRKHSIASKRAESTPAAKRRKIQASPDFKLEPGLLSPTLGCSSSPTVTSNRPKKKKRIPFTLVEASKGNRCPTEGCKGLGHITGLYAMHFAVSGCPMARGKTAEECKARREKLNRLLSKTIPNEGDESEAVASAVYGERSLRRTQRSTVDDLVGGRGSVASLSARKVHAQPASATTSTASVGLPAPQLARITQLHGLLINSKPLGYLRGEEPELEGLAPTQDLNLFREAQELTKKSLGMVEQEDSSDPSLPNYQLKVIAFGSHEVDTWYPSPYPADHTCLTKLYICEFCLKYFKSSLTLHKHARICSWRHPPGNEIYRHQGLSFFEVDGEKHKVYCQHLCLMAKLFLENKTLYFDVEPFLFYVLTQWDSRGAHMLGYFSKEKQSPQNYNLSCIVVLPQHMRQGYGHLMIDFSYLLTRREEKVGSPERPLSDLGLVSYRSYWKDAILTYILKHGGKTENISIKDISQDTGLSSDDIVSTLQFYSLLKYWKGKHIVLKRKDLLDEHAHKLEGRKGSPLVLETNHLQWTPEHYPIYT